MRLEWTGDGIGGTGTPARGRDDQIQPAEDPLAGHRLAVPRRVEEGIERVAVGLERLGDRHGDVLKGAVDRRQDFEEGKRIE